MATRKRGPWFGLLILAVAGAAGCDASPDATEVFAEYRDRVDARLRTIEAIHAQAEKLPRVTEDRLAKFDPPPDLRRKNDGPGRAEFVEIAHLLQTDRKSLGLDFIVSYDVTVTRIATLVRDGHYPPPNTHLKLENVEGWILRESLEEFLQLRYLFLIREIERKEPFLMGTQKDKLESRRYLPGHYLGEVLAFDVESGKHLGGFSFRVETDPEVKVNTNYYLTDLWRSLAKNAMKRIEERTKELCPEALVD
ncbi:MAG: hypothetical protein ACYTF8_16100 [Planctomycetota bacterium]|jgi:hypothetical protein